jgi:hypothetical protein
MSKGSNTLMQSKEQHSHKVRFFITEDQFMVWSERCSLDYDAFRKDHLKRIKCLGSKN